MKDQDRQILSEGIWLVQDVFQPWHFCFCHVVRTIFGALWQNQNWPVSSQKQVQFCFCFCFCCAVRVGQKQKQNWACRSVLFLLSKIPSLSWYKNKNSLISVLYYCPYHDTKTKINWLLAQFQFCITKLNPLKRQNRSSVLYSGKVVTKLTIRTLQHSFIKSLSLSWLNTHRPTVYR